MPHLPTRPMKLQLRQVALAVSLLGIFAGTAHAQVLVTDNAAISTNQEGFKSQLAQTVEQYTKQGMQYAKQLQQYETQLQQYEQMVMKVAAAWSVNPGTLGMVESSATTGRLGTIR